MLAAPTKFHGHELIHPYESAPPQEYGHYARFAGLSLGAVFPVVAEVAVAVARAAGVVELAAAESAATGKVVLAFAVAVAPVLAQRGGPV